MRKPRSVRGKDGPGLFSGPVTHPGLEVTSFGAASSPNEEFPHKAKEPIIQATLEFISFGNNVAIRDFL